jgi:hypothetical protein
MPFTLPVNRMEDITCHSVSDVNGVSVYSLLKESSYLQSCCIRAVTMEILKGNTNGFINFRGFLVGNPYVDPFTNTITQFASFYAHGLLAKPLYDEFVKSCSTPRAIQTTVSEQI